MSVREAMDAGYTTVITAGGDYPLCNMTHRADLSFDQEQEALVSAWTKTVSPDKRFIGRGIYPLR